MPRGSDLILPARVRRWVTAGRTDVGLFAYEGLGIRLHPAQEEAAAAVIERTAQFYDLWWAYRAGKTTLLCLLHMHSIFYKVGIEEPDSEREMEKWQSEGYRTLHCAPLGELAGRAWVALGDIISGTSKAQRDEDGKRREAPLASMFLTTHERVEGGSDRMFLRCMTGGVTDFRSTEGKAARLESGAWRLITWDEWPVTENTDDIRYILDVRLANRAADYDAPIVLTGTITPETEHIAKEFITKAEDPSQTDWWGCGASRDMNPSASRKAIERAGRNMDPEDYLRGVMGLPGGTKGRALPSWAVDNAFRADLPRWQEPDKSVDQHGQPIWQYVHVWDLAISSADNVGIVARVPADWQISSSNPAIGVALKVIPGSRTLIDREIVHAIEETYLPYGGLIVVDSTDAHGKNVMRELRRANYPVTGFDFHDRTTEGITYKARALKAVKEVLSDGLRAVRNAEGEFIDDAQGVPEMDRDNSFGSLRLPLEWALVRDQLAVVKPPPEDEKQRKDAAMVVYMLCDLLWRRKRSGVRAKIAPFPINAGRSYAGERTSRGR
jgi:hypothetical protein